MSMPCGQICAQAPQPRQAWGFLSSGRASKRIIGVWEKNILDDAEKAVTERSEAAAVMIEPKVHVVNELISTMTQNHFNRMSAGECSLLADTLFSNLMAEYKRVAGICSNTGMATLVRIHPELASKEHLFLETLDKTGDAVYRGILEHTHKKVFDQLNEAEGNGAYTQLELELPPLAPAGTPQQPE